MPSVFRRRSPSSGNGLSARPPLPAVASENTSPTPQTTSPSDTNTHSQPVSTTSSTVVTPSDAASGVDVKMLHKPHRRSLNTDNEETKSDASSQRTRKGSLHKTRRRISSMFRSSPSQSNLARTSQSPSSSPAPRSRPTDDAGQDNLKSTTLTPKGTSNSSKPPPAPSAGSGVSTPTKRKEPLQKQTDGYALLGVSNGDNMIVPAQMPNVLVAEPVSIHSASSAVSLESPLDTLATSNDVVIEQISQQPTRTRERSASLYSEWSYDYEHDDSDSDGEVYATPPEGLSEVEEGDEDDEEAKSRSIATVGQGMAGISLSEASAANASPISISTQEQEQEKSPISHTDSAIAISRAKVEHTATVPQTPATPTGGTSHEASLSVQDQTEALQVDIKMCQHIIELFLTSRMKDAEKLVYEQDQKGQHMYLQNAASVIQAIKGMMTFDATDLNTALDIARKTSALAHSLRKQQGSLLGKMAGVVRGGGGAAAIASMTLLEKHAELVYAESLLIKAVLGIVAGGDWVGLVREALNMRAAHGIYRTLQQYLDHAGNNGTRDGIDEHFKSGVELGTGLSSLMLSLMPGKVLRVAELFGYEGNRKVALSTLMAAGGWSHDPAHKEPDISAEEDGVRRPICDMALLVFHLVISVLMPVSGVNVPVAKNILDWNLRRYPNGIFFLYFQSRLHTTQAQPEMACATLQKALDLKLEYLQLQHMCLWDMGVNNMMLCQFNRSRGCFEILRQESNWSKAVYLYASGACLSELRADGQMVERQDELVDSMSQVPGNMKKIAGKSLPIEKFVSRKARKFVAQGNRLMLPAVELGYFFGALPNTPPRLLYNVVIPRIERNLLELENSSPEEYGQSEHEYWDDFCLANFLHGVSLSFAAYPHIEAVITPEDAATNALTPEDAALQAEKCFQVVLINGPKIQLDHWLVYHTHFELGRLYSQMGDNGKARHHLHLLLSGKGIDVSHHAKGKYSMESALMLKAHAGMQALKESHTAKMH